MSVFEMRDVSIRKLCVLDVCTRNMSVLKRCLYCRGVCIAEVSVFERCLYLRGVYIR